MAGNQRILDDQVYVQATRLGVKPARSNARSNRESFPDFVMEFKTAFAWSPRTEYTLADDEGEVSFGGPLQWVPDDCKPPGFEARDLVAVGMIDGGSWIAVVDANDPQPENPMLYGFDHESTDQEPDELGRLIDVLSGLTP